MEYDVKPMISQKKLEVRVQELGKQITSDFFATKEIILIGLLRGSVIFLADLARQIKLDAKIDFMTVSSYGSGMESSRDVKILKDLEEKIEGESVLIIEDIIDTGFTLKKVYEILSLRKPKTLKICTLLDKPERRQVKIKVDYVGFEIPDEFVVGYGIDYDQKHRNISYIGKVVVK